MSTQSEFLPGVINLGDILEENGYKQYFLMGSEAEFAGRDLYYKQHGNYTIYDYNYSLENGEIPEDCSGAMKMRNCLNLQNSI